MQRGDSFQDTMGFIPTTSGPRSYLGYISRILYFSSPSLPVLDYIYNIFPGYHALHLHHFRPQIIFRLYFQDTMRFIPNTSGPRSYLGYISRIPCASYLPLPALDHIQVIFPGYHALHPHHFRPQIIFRLYLRYHALHPHHFRPYIIFRLYFQHSMRFISTTSGPRSYLGYISRIPCASSPPLPTLDYIQVIFLGYYAHHLHHFRSQIIFRLYFQDTMLIIPTLSGPRLYLGFISRIPCSSFPPLSVLDHIQVIFPGYHAPHSHHFRSQIKFRLYFKGFQGST